MNSNAKAWPYGAPEGTVTLPPIMGWKIHFSAKAAHNDAVTWAPIYIGTCQNKKKNPSLQFCTTILLCTQLILIG